ncbi:hypothetical protein AB9F42_02995 [Rhizobium leguminosarum]|uniref:hypothetical protein n=1 Tax=Rhizobium TaxID=379 RepID=UPI0010385F5E|nr:MULTISPECIES: hypothetical protein [Rhizobium]MBY5651798.1 hypothetical protein [Rhizobium leguminosarum]NKL45807.1 hypothetical protein [Rhizobium leguminosarum bv. viciae]TBB32427.1 hypothetical protein ELH47_11030 [Rhizobium ruizarguesonis]TBZ05559.1 hypothetical protein E0H38_33910 [Rhizobium leguminosarum bv. viciae]
MPSENNLRQALEDVRAAYRLLYAYQRRTLDTISLVTDQFPDRTFYQWSNLLCDMPPARGKTPFGRWTWDFMPLYNTSFLFTKGGDASNYPQEGDWLLEVKLGTDTGHAEFWGRRTEPSIADLGDVADAKSALSLIVWKCAETFPKNSNWYNDVWYANPWPSMDVIEAGNAAVVADGKIRSFQVDTLLEELEDRASVIRFTNSAKATFAGALDMDFG